MEQGSDHSSDGPAYHDKSRCLVIPDDSQFAENSTTQSIQEYPEDDIVWGDPEREDGHPVSADAPNSDNSELGDPEDVVVLEQSEQGGHSERARAVEENQPAFNARMFSRPDSSEEPDVDATFSFGKASRQQMDFVGKRKGPVSYATPMVVHANKSAQENSTREDANSQGNAPYSELTHLS